MQLLLFMCFSVLFW